MPDHNYFANLIWQIADLLRGPYRPPQYERVMLPMTVLRRFDCVLAPTKASNTLALIAGAFSVACAVFLILELDHPFAGVIRIPSEPMTNVLNRLGK